jgi:DNA invertase Pin-like site-specific DNA recombinase
MESSRKLRVAHYHRVSRLDQDPRLQADATIAFTAARGWETHEVYVDHGVSGSKDRRPALDRMLADGRHRKFDLILVYRSDRLFRSLKHLVAVVDDLSALGIDFVSTTEPFDTTTPSGRLLLQLVGALAEMERGLLIERTKAGIASARRRGVRVGRPPVHVDVPRAMELRASGMSLREVARELKVGAATVHRALSAADTGTV